MANNNYRKMIDDFLAPYNAKVVQVEGRGLDYKAIYIEGSNGNVYTEGGKDLKNCYNNLVKRNPTWLYKADSYK